MGGELATAYVRIRANLAGLQAQITEGVRAAVTGAQAQVAASSTGVGSTAKQAEQLNLVAAGYKEVASAAVSAGVAEKDAAMSAAETVAATARKNVAATLNEIKANQALAVSYKEIGASAVRGSEEAAAAAKLAADATAAANARLGVGLEAGAARGSAAVGGLKTHVLSLTNVLGVGIGAAFAVKLAKDVVQGAASVQKSQEVVRAQFGQSGTAITKWANQGGLALGVTDKLSLSTAARFGILFKNIGIGQPQAAKMTVGFEQLASSIAAIRGIDPATVLQNLPLAAAGNVRSLKQLGIAVDQNTLKIAAFKLGLTQSISQALTPAQRAIAIYAIGTANLPSYLDQAKAHSHDLANEQRRLSAEWDHAKNIIGTALLPTFSNLTTKLADWLQKMSNSGRLQQDVNRYMADAKSIVSGLKGAFDSILPPIQAAIGAVGGLGNAVKIMVAAWAAWKVVGILSSLGKLTSGIKGADGAVGKLKGSLLGLRALGVIGVTVAVGFAVAKGGEALSKYLGGTLVGQTLGIGDTNSNSRIIGLIQQDIKTKPRPEVIAALQKLISDKSGIVGAPAKAFAQKQLDSLTAPQRAAAEAAKSFAPGATSPFDQIVQAIQKKASDVSKQTRDSLAAALAQGIKDGTLNGTGGAATNPAIQEAQRNIDLLKEKLSQTIQQNTIDIKNTVVQAKQNLASIGSDLANSIGSVLDQPLVNMQNKLTAEQNRTSLELLRRSVVFPGGKGLSKNPDVALSELRAKVAQAADAVKPVWQNFYVQYAQQVLAVKQDEANQRKIVATRTISDVTDAINKGQITAAQGAKRISALLAKDGVTYKKAGSLLGSAFADGFQAQVKGLLDQAKALAGFTKVGGTGLEKTIVQPALTVAKDQREIAQQQLRIAKAQTALQTRAAKAAEKTARIMEELQSTKVNASAFDKNPSKQGKTSAKLARSTR